MTYQERLFRQNHGYHCEPTTWMLVGSLVISAVSAASQVQQQKFNADAQADSQAKLTEANNATSYEQEAQLRLQQAQDSESAAREGEKARLTTQKTVASATTAAGESGATGNSVDALLGEYKMQLGQFREASQRQQTLKASAYDSQVEALRTGAKYQNLQINAPIAGPNYAGAALQFAGDAMGAYRAYNPGAFKKPTKTGTT